MMFVWSDLLLCGLNSLGTSDSSQSVDCWWTKFAGWNSPKQNPTIVPWNIEEVEDKPFLVEMRPGKLTSNLKKQPLLERNIIFQISILVFQPLIFSRVLVLNLPFLRGWTNSRVKRRKNHSSCQAIRWCCPVLQRYMEIHQPRCMPVKTWRTSKRPGPGGNVEQGLMALWKGMTPTIGFGRWGLFG